MVNQWLQSARRIIACSLISLLIPFISGYSTNIKRFALKLATL